MLHGARLVYHIAKITEATLMIGQKRSPSCSCHQIYDGSFQRKLIEGYGVASAFLEKSGLRVLDIEDISLLL